MYLLYVGESENNYNHLQDLNFEQSLSYKYRRTSFFSNITRYLYTFMHKQKGY